jgi:hypothetical protein
MKQILIAQGDTGVPIEITLIDNKKSAIPLYDLKFKVYIVRPDGTERILTSDNGQVTVVDYASGKIQIELTSADTAQLKNHDIYVELSDSDSVISSVSAISYYVVAKNGGK